MSRVFHVVGKPVSEKVEPAGGAGSGPCRLRWGTPVTPKLKTSPNRLTAAGGRATGSSGP